MLQRHGAAFYHVCQGLGGLEIAAGYGDFGGSVGQRNSGSTRRSSVAGYQHLGMGQAQMFREWLDDSFGIGIRATPFARFAPDSIHGAYCLWGMVTLKPQTGIAAANFIQSPSCVGATRNGRYKESSRRAWNARL